MLSLLSTAPIHPQAHRVIDVDGEAVLEVLRAWPAPALHRNTAATGWAERRPNLHVGCAGGEPMDLEHPGNADAVGWSVPLSSLFASIPDEARAALRAQPAGVSWASLKRLSDVPELLSVVGDIPSSAGSSPCT